MAANNSDMETGDFGPMTLDEGVDRLAGILADSNAAPEEPESEETEAEQGDEPELAEDADFDLSDDDVAEEAELSEDDEDEVEYEAADEAADDVEHPDYIEIDGEKVTLDEVGNGYLRQADYTKKTQQLAEQRKSVEAEAAEIAKEREHLKKMLEAFAQPDSSISEAELAELARNDPLEYIAKKAEIDSERAKREAAMAEMQRLTQEEEIQRRAAFEQYVEQEKQRLVQALPELATENGAKYRADLLTYMEGVGFAKNELANLFDHRAVVLADKARKYDELMSKGKVATKKARNAPKVVKPGVQRSNKAKAADARKKALARARKSGSVDDAVNALLSR